MSNAYLVDVLAYMARRTNCPRCRNASHVSIDLPIVLVKQDADNEWISTNSARCGLCGWASLMDALISAEEAS